MDHCLHVISWTIGWTVTKFASLQVYKSDRINSLLDFGDLDLIFKVTASWLKLPPLTRFGSWGTSVFSGNIAVFFYDVSSLVCLQQDLFLFFSHLLFAPHGLSSCNWPLKLSNCFIVRQWWYMHLMTRETGELDIPLTGLCTGGGPWMDTLVSGLSLLSLKLILLTVRMWVWHISYLQKLKERLKAMRRPLHWSSDHADFP